MKGQERQLFPIIIRLKTYKILQTERLFQCVPKNLQPRADFTMKMQPSQVV